MARNRNGKSVITIIVGLSFLLGALLIGYRFLDGKLPRAVAFVESGQITQGEITGYSHERARVQRNRNRRSSIVDMYAPIVRFTTDDGQIVTFESSLNSSERPYRRGERVEVIYLPDDPATAEINTFMARWFGLVLVGSLVIASLLLGVFLIGYARRTDRDGHANRYSQPGNAPATGPGRAGTRLALAFAFLLIAVPLCALGYNLVQKGIVPMPDLSSLSEPIPVASVGTVVAHLDPADNTDARGRDLPAVMEVITFNTEEGQRTTFGVTVDRAALLPVGETVDVLYDRDNPHDARIGRHPFAGSSWPTVFVLAVVAIMVIALIARKLVRAR